MTLQDAARFWPALRVLAVEWRRGVRIIAVPVLVMMLFELVSSDIAISPMFEMWWTLVDIALWIGMAACIEFFWFQHAFRSETAPGDRLARLMRYCVLFAVVTTATIVLVILLGVAAVTVAAWMLQSADAFEFFAFVFDDARPGVFLATACVTSWVYFWLNLRFAPILLVPLAIAARAHDRKALWRMSKGLGRLLMLLSVYAAAAQVLLQEVMIFVEPADPTTLNRVAITIYGAVMFGILTLGKAIIIARLYRGIIWQDPVAEVFD